VAPDLTLPSGFETVDVGFSDLRTLAEEIVRYGVDVIVLEPPELRTRVLEMLSSVVSSGTEHQPLDSADERVPA
jgi:proteasome accessory factor B